MARRFSSAVISSLRSLIDMPEAGAPKVHANPPLVGLRTWAVKGFDEFRISYLATPEVLTVVRVLHEKRDTQAVLQDE